MYHSITIGEKNTWDDWHLIPASRPLVAPPQVKEISVDIPGGDGILDLTDSLAGRPTYTNRTGSWTFYVENGFREWSDLFSEIMAYLHGREFKMTLEDDPDYFYEGRFSVNEWRSEKNWSTIVINYSVGPYKKSSTGSGEDWLWDPFNFETDIIRSYRDLIVHNTLEVTVLHEAMATIPTILCSASGMRVDFGNGSYPLVKGSNIIPDIILQEGENEFVFHGNGTVTIEVLEGRL